MNVKLLSLWPGPGDSQRFTHLNCAFWFAWQDAVIWACTLLIASSIGCWFPSSRCSLSLQHDLLLASPLQQKTGMFCCHHTFVACRLLKGYVSQFSCGGLQTAPSRSLHLHYAAVKPAVRATVRAVRPVLPLRNRARALRSPEELLQ